MAQHDQTDERLEALARPLALTRAALVAERAAVAFWPLASVLFAGAALWLSGVLPVLPLAVAQGLVGLILIGALAGFGWGMRRYRHPSRAEAAERLDSTLAGRPLAALADSQAIGADDSASRAVWAAHRARMAARLKGAKPPAPRPALAWRDPYALRLIALTALIMAGAFGLRTAPGELAALVPGAGPGPVAEASWEGWIEPPSYTGKPVLYLPDQPAGPLSVPTGSRVTLRLYGKIGAIRVEDSWSQSGPDDPTRAFKIDRDGTLRVGASHWQIAATADSPPEVRPDGELDRKLAGEMHLPFTARDDYGVSAGQASIALDLGRVDRRYGLAAEPENRPDIVVDLPMPFRGGRSEIAETLVGNFSTHPWAGLPVQITLAVTDAAGQQGQSAPMEIVLPGRRFLDPLAAAIIEMRRDMLWSLDNLPRAARILRAVSNRPEGLFARDVQYLKLRTAVRQIERGLDSAGRDEVAQVLWDLAVEIEDGALSDALERLRRAQDRLSEAMKQGATPDELSELMDEYRQAMADYMQKLAEQGGEQGDQQQQAQGQQMQMSQQDLQAMMDRIEELMRQGRTAEAQQLLNMLQQMMENARIAEGGAGQQGPGAQAMQGLRDTLNQQQGLSDQAFENLQNRQRQQGQQSEPGQQGQQGQSPDGTRPGQGAAGERELSERQRALEGQLGQQRNDLPGAGSPEGDAAREALNRAGRAMDEAADALEQGDTSGALDRQAEAMEALREGMRNLGEAMRQAQADQPGGQGQPGGEQGDRRQADPLGRNPGGSGATATDSPLADGEDVYRRAQELTDELRRRAGEPQRPEIERDYIKRLLDQF